MLPDSHASVVLSNAAVPLHIGRALSPHRLVLLALPASAHVRFSPPEQVNVVVSIVSVELPFVEHVVGRKPLVQRP